MKTTVLKDIEKVLKDLYELSEGVSDEEAKGFFSTAYSNVEIWKRKIEYVMGNFGIEEKKEKKSK